MGKSTLRNRLAGTYYGKHYRYLTSDEKRDIRKRAVEFRRHKYLLKKNYLVTHTQKDFVDAVKRGVFR